MTEFMQNYVKMLKYTKMCGKHQFMQKVVENVKLCDSAPTAPKRCPCPESSINLFLFAYINH